MVLLDTDIIIDVLREYEPALVWVGNLDEEIALSGFTAMELVQGCAQKTEQRKVEKILRSMRIFWPSPTGCQAALELFIQLRLSHNIGLLDALIAQTAIENNIPLHTFNIKHYSVVSALTTIQPYQK